MTTTGRQITLSVAEDAACCSLSEGPIEADHAQRLAAMFKAPADPTRLRLLSHVTAQGCQDVCACDLTEELQITQPTVSHHMKSSSTLVW